MSKTGDNLRNYGRMYPGLINNTTIVYFMPWPTEALFEVANASLRVFDFDDTLRSHIAEFFSNAHTKVIALSDRMYKELKRIYYVTPTNYIELVKGYSELLNSKREEIGSEIKKLGGGLSKLDEAQQNSNELQKNLAIFNNELGKKSKDCEELMIKIDKETRESKDKKNELAERESQVNKEKGEIEHLKADAEADLKKAEPALQAAEMGLANLTKDKLSVVKSYSTPPGGVDVVLNAVMILLNKEPSWAVAKKELADTSFLQRLQTIDKGRVPINTLKRIEKLTQDPKMEISRIDTISEAAGGLWRWVLAVEGYAKAFKDIEPKKNKVNNLMEKLKKSEEELQTLRDNFAQVQKIINDLNYQLDKAKSDMESFKVQTEQLNIKLERADKLISGLGSTKEGWRERKEILEEKYNYLVGDSLMTAAFLSYAGPFPSEYRESFLAEDLLGKVRQYKISHSKDYNFP
jgi:dynein heavy chain, axonemal